MNTGLLSKKYAVALFGFARKKGEVETVENDLNALREFLKRDATLITFLESPDVLDSHKETLLKDVFGQRVSRSVLEFLLLLFRKKRMRLLENICDDFESLALEARGVQRAKVITAFKLRDDLRDSLGSALESVTRKKIVLQEEVNPELIGGAVIIVHNKVIDDSVRTKLEKLRDSLISTRVH
ncbi:MAG: F0F1 ATP synthase subunit delta [Candidatus Eisenbacteria bacterium]|nr:F0F1 ATP synthase subunit delta [Candidatus Eisenbacteria bacterium]